MKVPPSLMAVENANQAGVIAGARLTGGSERHMLRPVYGSSGWFAINQ